MNEKAQGFEETVALITLTLELTSEQRNFIHDDGPTLVVPAKSRDMLRHVEPSENSKLAVAIREFRDFSVTFSSPAAPPDKNIGVAETSQSSIHKFTFEIRTASDSGTNIPAADAKTDLVSEISTFWPGDAASGADEDLVKRMPPKKVVPMAVKVLRPGDCITM